MVGEGERQEAFNLWVTEAANKEQGGIYDWSTSQVAIKRILKPTKKEQPVPNPKEDLEEGEFEEGEF